MPEWSDREIVDRFSIQGDRDQAFTKLVEKYQEKLYWHIRKIVIDHDDADDVLQNTFIKTWKGLDAFREDATLFTWLYRIATNEALTLLKQKKRAQFVPLEGQEHRLGENLDSGLYVDGNEIQIKLQKAIISLPEKQRVVFNMKYFDEMKYEQMAEILETSVGALKASYHHAVKKIEKMINND